MITAEPQGDLQRDLDVKLPTGQVLSATRTGPRALYTEIINGTKIIPTAQRKWETSIDTENQAEWENLYSRTFSITRETKYQSFQYRLLHRVITCNHLLYRWRMREDGVCQFCDGEDTLEHFFYSCPQPRAFWSLVKNWVLAATQVSPYISHLTIKEFLLGVPRDFPQALIINYLLLHGRFFIPVTPTTSCAHTCIQT